MYSLKQFLDDINQAISFDVLKKLESNGHPAILDDDYAKNGPQFMRRQFFLTANSARELIDAGLPETASMQMIAHFISPDLNIVNRGYVLATVNVILESSSIKYIDTQQNTQNEF